MKKSRIQCLMAFALGVSFVLACMVILSGPVSAQSTYGTITGSVTDSSGGAVADAQVRLSNLGTSELRIQSTGSDGLYSFVNLFPGKYKVDVEKAGFKRTSRTDIVVEVQQTSRIDLTMQVGEVTQTVEVTGETPLLQPETSSLGQVIEQRQANELPLNGRNVYNLAALSPSVVPQGHASNNIVGQNPFDLGNYQIGGSFANQGAEYLDGQPLNIGYINLPLVVPTQDSIGEYKVQTNNQGAEWGKFSGGIVNLSTKSGTNSWHGSAYEYFRNKVLNTNEYFHKKFQLENGLKNEPPPWSQNQYGLQLGGPVIKDKTFFYVSWEQYRQRTGSPNTTTVPAAGMLTGDFSALCTAGFTNGVCNTPAGAIYDPYTVNQSTGARQPYGLDPGNPSCPGNCIPSAEFSQAATTIWQKVFPAANGSGVVNNFSSAAASGGNTNEFVVRGDQNIGNN